MNGFDLKLILKRLGMTQLMFSELVGYNYSYINAIANNKIGMPKHMKALLILMYKIGDKNKILTLIDEWANEHHVKE